MDGSWTVAIIAHSLWLRVEDGGILRSWNCGFQLPNLTTQIHDYSPGISANGLFWIIPVPADSVVVNLDSATASLRAENVPVMDAHDLANSLTGGKGLANPPIPPIAPVPETVSFDIEWSGFIEGAKIVNETENFRSQYVKTGATISWSAHQTGFHVCIGTRESCPQHLFGNRARAEWIFLLSRLT